jgi:hypothetical protein
MAAARALMPDNPRQQLDPNCRRTDEDRFQQRIGTMLRQHPCFDVTAGRSDLQARKVCILRDGRPRAGVHFAFSADSVKLMLFDFQSQKWAELANGSLSWLNRSHDGQYVYVMDFRGHDAVVRIRVRDRKIERVVDLKSFAATGRYGADFLWRLTIRRCCSRHGLTVGVPLIGKAEVERSLAKAEKENPAFATVRNCGCDLRRGHSSVLRRRADELISSRPRGAQFSRESLPELLQDGFEFGARRRTDSRNRIRSSRRRRCMKQAVGMESSAIWSSARGSVRYPTP